MHGKLTSHLIYTFPNPIRPYTSIPPFITPPTASPLSSTPTLTMMMMHAKTGHGIGRKKDNRKMRKNVRQKHKCNKGNSTRIGIRKHFRVRKAALPSIPPRVPSITTRSGKHSVNIVHSESLSDHPNITASDL